MGIVFVVVNVVVVLVAVVVAAAAVTQMKNLIIILLSSIFHSVVYKDILCEYKTYLGQLNNFHLSCIWTRQLQQALFPPPMTDTVNIFMQPVAYSISAVSVSFYETMK
jgi:hypothetical protein